MIGLLTGAVAGCLVMLVTWSSSWLGPGFRPREPFALAPEWHGRPVIRHRATPAPDRGSGDLVNPPARKRDTTYSFMVSLLVWCSHLWLMGTMLMLFLLTTERN